MAVTPVPTVTPLPTPPSTNDPGSFDQRGDDFLGALPGFQTQTNALATSVFNNATDAANSATTANSAKDTAVSAKDSAVSAASTATSSKDTAVAAKDTAVNAKDLAVTAKNDAVAANTAAQQAKTDTQAFRNQAEIFATQQTVATSTTEFANTIGSKNITLSANKPFIPNVTFLRGASRSTPLAKNAGYVTAYNASTGAATIAISEVSGPATNFNDWDFALGSPGGTPGLSIVTPDTVTNCNDLPNNSITRINAVTSTAAAKNLPYLVANSASSGWSFNIPWVVETVGFDTLYKTQTATPVIASSNSGVGLSFVRVCENGTWGAWRPRGGLPSSIITTDGNHMYDTGGAIGLNRRNIISGSLNGAPCNKYMPTPPVDGDVCIVVTNARADNRLYPIGGVSIRTGDVIVNEGESLGLDMPYTAYQFTFYKDHNNWFAG